MSETLNNTANEQENTSVETNVNITEKTFTQSDIDRIVNERLTRERKSIPSEVDLKEYKEWKKSQQTEAEKAAEREAEYQRTKSELQIIKTEKDVIKSGCKPEFSEFVASKVISMIDEKTPFETAISNYKKNNPQYFGEMVIKKTATSHSLSGSENRTPTNNEIMNDLIRNGRS